MKPVPTAQLALDSIDPSPLAPHRPKVRKPVYDRADVPQDHLLRRREVQQLTGLSRTALYRLIAEGDFPAQVKLTCSAVAWSAIAVQGWIAVRVAASKRSAAATR